MKTRMSYFGNASIEDHDNTTLELVKRFSELTDQLEMKGQEVRKLETNTEEVNVLVFCFVSFG